jgi:hypothetical protein
LIRFCDAVALAGFSAGHLEIPERVVLSALGGGKVLDEKPNAAIVRFTFSGLQHTMTANEAQAVPPGAQSSGRIGLESFRTCRLVMVRAADLSLEALNHLRVDFTPFTSQRMTKAVPHGMTFAVLVKVLRSRGHFRTMPVGKVGNEGSYQPTELSMLMAVSAGASRPCSLRAWRNRFSNRQRTRSTSRLVTAE